MKRRTGKQRLEDYIKRKAEYRLQQAQKGHDEDMRFLAEQEEKDGL